MNDQAPTNKEIERFKKLHQKRREILALPAGEALDHILGHPQPAALVHSFPESDFYFLMHDIGPEDSLPLLQLASKRQWEYIIDLEAWDRDRIDTASLPRWLSLLQEADPKRFVHWCLQEKLELIEFYLFKNIEVRILEHDQDPSDFGDGFVTLDSTYYVRFIEHPPEPQTGQLTDDQRIEFLKKFLGHLSTHDHKIYQQVLLEATHVILSETEEENYHWRNVRLAEKGFLPFDEAVGIYQPLKVEDLESKSARPVRGSSQEFSLLPVPEYPFRLLEQNSHFARALRTIQPGDVLQEIQIEFANLCNQIIVADNKTIRDRNELTVIVKKACSYVSIGLERLSGFSPSIDPAKAATLINRHSVGQIFRLGFGQALELKWQAEKWFAQCWFAGRGLRLTFWGEQWLGVLGGLLIKKPLFYDNYRSGVLYREFESSEDILETTAIFDQIKEMDNLLSRVSINLRSLSSYGFITFKNLILTLWAAHECKRTNNKLEPIPVNEFISFYKEFLPGKPGPAAIEQRRVPLQMKETFLNWLAADSGLSKNEIVEKTGPTFEALFKELEEEYGQVAAEDLAAEHVNLFLLE